MLVGSLKLFSEAKGGACSLRGLGAAWGVQLGKIGGAGADQGSAGEAWGVQMKHGGADCGYGGTGADLGEQHGGCSSSMMGGAAWLPMTSFQIHFWSSVRWMLLEY